MKQLYMLRLLFILTSTSLLAQSGDTINKDKKNRILSPDAFNRMVIHDITYAIVGESTPISGVKVDVSKPEGTVSGMFPIDKSKCFDVIGFELKGGVTDRNFSFLKGYTSANSAYEFKTSFHWIPNVNSAWFKKDNQNFEKKMVRTRNKIVERNAERLEDTIKVINDFYDWHTKNKENIVTKRNDTFKEIAKHILSKIAPSQTTDTIMSYDEIIKCIPKLEEIEGEDMYSDKTYNDAIIKLYEKYEKGGKARYEAKLEKQIENADQIWTFKNYTWITFSPYVRTEKVNEHYTTYQGLDSLYFKAKYRWYYGASLQLNKYWLTQSKKAILWRVGISVSHNNNLSTLTGYEYETRTPFFENGTSVTEKIKKGLAYNHADIKTGFEKQINSELYYLPLTLPIPGIYISGNITHSDLYHLPTIKGRKNDEIKVGAEGGLVFNINNRDKDKTILSILTYFRYEDLTDTRRTSTITGITEPKQDFQERNISMGIRVGIPIYLPKTK